jgi:hypothetical protein
LQGSYVLRRGGALDLQSVLVGARQEVDLVAREAVKPRQGVGHDRGVSVADVGSGVYVIDWRSDVKLFGLLVHSNLSIRTEKF